MNKNLWIKVLIFINKPFSIKIFCYIYFFGLSHAAIETLNFKIYNKMNQKYIQQKSVIDSSLQKKT